MNGLRMDVCANSTELRLIRRALSAWLTELNVSADDTFVAVLVVNELVTNAIHASRSPNSRVTIDVQVDNDQLSAEVGDDGPAFILDRPATVAPDDRDHGRGLLIVDRLTDAMWSTRRNGRTIVGVRRCVGTDTHANTHTRAVTNHSA